MSSASSFIQLLTGTSGHRVPYLDGDNVQSGDLNHTALARFQGLVDQGVLGFSRIDIGVNTNIPRIILETIGTVPWGIDTDGGHLRFYLTSGFVPFAILSNPKLVYVANGWGFVNLGCSVSGVASLAGDQTLADNSTYYQEYTGTGGHTWTLPARSSNVGLTFRIKNIGSGADLVISRAGADQIFSTASVTTVSIPVGGSRDFTAGNTYWNMSGS